MKLLVRGFRRSGPAEPDDPRSALLALGYQLKRVAKYREVYGVDLHGHGKLVKDYVGAAARAHADDYDSWGGILKKILENVERAAVKQQAKQQVHGDVHRGRR